MSYQRFFDGIYFNDKEDKSYSIETIRNPNGLILSSFESGRKIEITVDDLLDFADKINLHDEDGPGLIRMENLSLNEK